MKNNITVNFCEKIKNIVQNINSAESDKIQEIRLRIKKPLCVFINNKNKYVSLSGHISDSPYNAYIVTEQDIAETYKIVCQYSIHSFQKEINNGYITVNGGHRVGLCGTAVYNENSIHNIKYISGLNFRIARQIKGCAENIINKVFSDGLNSLLIVGPPSSGKTTLLKDICRQLGDRYKISLIDERGEIGAVYNGIAQNDVGMYTDVFDGYSKKDGIEIALRVMSPQIIICDEIGTSEDYFSLMNSMNSGVKVIASTHASDINQLLKKPYILQLLNSGIFDYICELDELFIQGSCEKIKRVDELDKIYRFNNDNYNDNFNRLLHIR